MTATVEYLAAVADQEFAPTADQLRTLRESCLYYTVNVGENKLSQAQKDQLKSALDKIRTLVGDSVDLLIATKSRLKEQRKILEDEQTALGEADTAVSDFFKLLGPAISSCSDVQLAASQIKAEVDRTTVKKSELGYRIQVTYIKEGTLSSDISDAQSALAVIDKLKLALG